MVIVQHISFEDKPSLLHCLDPAALLVQPSRLQLTNTGILLLTEFVINVYTIVILSNSALRIRHQNSVFGRLAKLPEIRQIFDISRLRLIGSFFLDGTNPGLINLFG